MKRDRRRSLDVLELMSNLEMGFRDGREIADGLGMRISVNFHIGPLFQLKIKMRVICGNTLILFKFNSHIRLILIIIFTILILIWLFQ